MITELNKLMSQWAFELIESCNENKAKIME